jgi:hypothetical protein
MASSESYEETSVPYSIYHRWYVAGEQRCPKGYIIARASGSYMRGL